MMIMLVFAILMTMTMNSLRLFAAAAPVLDGGIALFVAMRSTSDVDSASATEPKEDEEGGKRRAKNRTQHSIEPAHPVLVEEEMWWEG